MEIYRENRSQKSEEQRLTSVFITDDGQHALPNGIRSESTD